MTLAVPAQHLGASAGHRDCQIELLDRLTYRAGEPETALGELPHILADGDATTLVKACAPLVSI